MTKLKFAGLASLIAGGALFAASFVSADTSSLAVACSGTVSSTVITWNAVASSGTAPYSFAWTGDSHVAGSTSTSIVATYSANGTYTANVQATDASSTVATSTCSAAVTSIVTPTPTSTLNVFVAINNAAGGAAIPSNFIVTVAGASANPNSFVGSGSGTAVVVNAASAYSVGANTLANYSTSVSGTCSGPIAAGGSAMCTVTETYVPPTVTPPVFVMKPSLAIGENGQFLTRGMKVISVSSGSFQGQVWGITYTVNWSGNLLDFYFRYNKAATTIPSTQLAVGDEVGVSGKLDPSAPFVVNANVVRDYSITMARPPHSEGQGNGEGNKNGNNGSSSNNNSDMRSRLNDLLKQLQNLQNLFHGRSGK